MKIVVMGASGHGQVVADILFQMWTKGREMELVGFLDDDQKEKIKEISGELVEQVVVTSRAWDERGRQYGSPKPHYLIRRDHGRWYINNFEQPF